MKTLQKKTITAHVISHTHWDREWYLPFQQYRIRLVKLIDSLLDRLPQTPDYRAFHLDAQAIVLEDYLEVRPERRKQLEKLIRQRRILVGPWYILPDEFLVSGEATIRNLMLGHRLSKEFGHTMRVGYVPDPFGHISQMPQILRGFGLDNFIFARGYDGAGGKKASEFIWESPDGSRVFAYYLPSSYTNAWRLNFFPNDFERSREFMEQCLKKIAPWSAIPHQLIMNGMDHDVPVFEIPGLLRQINRKPPGYRFVHTTLENFVRQANKYPCRRPLVRGELRRNGIQHLLYGILSARTYLKQRNHAVQQLLEKWAEPAAAAAWLTGVAHPKALLWQAWKYLLQNHPHDSICGCSIDPVHSQMMTRFAWAKEIGEHVTGAALANIAGQIKTVESPDLVCGIAVFNPLARRRSGCEEIEVDMPKDCKDTFHLTDTEGRHVPSALLATNYQLIVHPHDRVFSYFTWTNRCRLLVDASKIPPCGYATFRILRGKGPGEHSALTVSAKQRCVENEYLKLKLAKNGSLQIIDKATGRKWSQLNVFEDIADTGDEYNYSPPDKDKRIDSTKTRYQWEFVHAEPLRAGFRVRMDLRLPKSLSHDRKSRSPETVLCRLETIATLDAGSKRVDVLTRFQNNVGDHNLRVLFPSGARNAKVSSALGAFDVVQRPIVPGRHEPNATEAKPSRHPMDGFTSVSDQKGGLTVGAAGLYEFEVKPDNARTIAVTLLRAVGWLSRNDLKTRKGHAGIEFATPEAQCPGEHVFRYCLIPHTGNWEQNQPWKEVLAFLNPMRGITLPVNLKSYDGNRAIIPACPPSLPASLSLLAIEPESILLSAVKKAEERDALIVRAWNIGQKTVSAKFTFAQPVRQAYSVNFAEKRLKRLAVKNGNTVEMPCKPKQIVTLEIQLACRMD